MDTVAAERPENGDATTLLLHSRGPSATCCISIGHPPTLKLSPTVNTYQLKIEPVTLTWQNLDIYARRLQRDWRFWQRNKKERMVHILKNVSGVARPGQLLAILGASGAGKTTLMDVLTGRRLNKLIINGNIQVNGEPVGKAIASVSAYVQQEDLFIGTVTVREHLLFQAMMRMDRSCTFEQRVHRVNEVISELGLTKCADTVIGIPGRIKGISGGERKRLAFASEVLTNRSLLFCDEPTSGLDSFMAQSVVSVLRQMAEGGRTIVCTIHQPSSDIYAMFDRVLYLTEGRVAFCGDLPKALEFFASHGLQCPTNFNPADFFIEKLAIVPGQEQICQQRIDEICNKFADSKLKEEVLGTEVHEVDTLLGGASTDRSLKWQDSERNSATVFVQFKGLFWRSFLSTKREPYLTTVRLAQTIALSLLLGALYWQQQVKELESIMNFNGLLFLMVSALSFQNIFFSVNVFCSELPVFLREHSNGLYRADIYFLSKTISELPFYIVIAVAMTSIAYWMAGLHNDAVTFLHCLATMILVSFNSCSFGYAVSCIAKEINLGLALCGPLVGIMMMFSGFLINNKSIPVYFVWMKYISWFSYGTEVLSISQWGKIECIGEEPFCMAGTDVLKTLHFDENNILFDYIFLLVLMCGYRLIAFLALLARTRNMK